MDIADEQQQVATEKRIEEAEREDRRYTNSTLLLHAPAGGLRKKGNEWQETADLNTAAVGLGMI